MTTDVTSRRCSRRTVALTSALVLAVLAGGISAPSAHAAPSDMSATVPTMIVLDASGSMLADDAPGLRIDAAKQAVSNLVSGLPQSSELGLIVYGTGTGNSDAEMAAGCEDIKTLVPLGPVNAPSFISTVDGIQASGYTRMGSALRAAADALPADGPRSIMLVSDGIDTCAPPPPCEVAAELAAGGLDLVIHTVGFRVDDDARAELECIAQAANGTYKDAGDSKELDDALRVQVNHAINGYTAEGQPVTGAAEMTEDAPLLGEGQYVDTLENGSMLPVDRENAKFYRLDVPEGWTAHVSATMSVPVGASDETDGWYFNLSLELYEADMSFCASQVSMSSPDTRAGVTTKVLHSNECEQPTYLQLARDGQKFSDVPATVEILIRYQPPADASDLPTPEVLEAPAEPEHNDSATAITGGLSYNEATVLAAGETYESTVVTGETRYFQIPVTWGQQIAYTITFTGKDSGDNRWSDVRMFTDNPLREKIPFFISGGSWAPGFGGTEEYGAGSEEKVRYGSEYYGLDGDYYLRVQADDTQGDAYELTFLLTMITPGDIEPGPVYDYSAIESSSPMPAQAPEGSAESPRTAVSGAMVWVVIGAVILLAAATGTWVVVRRRKEKSHE